MGNIPFDPHLDTMPGLEVPAVRVAVEAAGAEARAAGRMIGVGDQALKAGLEWKQRQVEGAFESDLIAGRAMYKTLSMQRDAELAQIAVSNDTDYDKKAAEIRKRYNQQWNGWAKTNFRNQGFRYVKKQLGDELQAFEAESEYRVAERKVIYNRELSKSNLNLALQTAIESDDAEAIETNMAARVSQGFLTEAEAKDFKERAIRDKDEAWDNRKLQEADSLIADAVQRGVDVDPEAVHSKVDSLRLHSVAQKRELKRSLIDRSFFTGTKEQISALKANGEGLSMLGQIEKSLHDRKRLDDSYRDNLQTQINATRREIVSAQLKNQEKFITAAKEGTLDWMQFEKASRMDNEEGIPSDLVEATRKLLKTELRGFQQKERFEADREFIGYIDLRSRLLSERFGKYESGNINKKELAGKTITGKREETYANYKSEIEDLAVGNLAKAQLFEDFLLMRQTDLMEGTEDLPGLWNKRDIGEAEKAVRNTMNEFYRRTLKTGVPSDFIQTFEADDKKMRQFFTQNHNPSPEQLDNLVSEIQNPSVQRQMRAELRGASSANRSELQAITIRNKKEYDALPAGTLFIFDGEAGRK